MKVVLDTHIFVSYILSSSRTSQAIMEWVFSEKIELILSSEIVEELKETLKKPRLQKFINASRREQLMSRFPLLVNTLISVEVDIVRDSDDNKIVETAISGYARYILTYNKDLLDLEPKHVLMLRQKYDLSLLKPSDFMKEHGNELESIN